MYSNMKIVILILLLFTGGSVIKAQRHYKRISALEGSYGTNIFGKADNMANISFSKYIDRTSYWKAGLNYFEKSFDYSVNTEATQPYAGNAEPAKGRNSPELVCKRQL